MKTVQDWLSTPTQCLILTCDGKGVAAKREALASVIEAVQQDAILSTCNSMAFTDPPPINKNENITSTGR
ncbi:MAG: hypothetical protein EBU46_00095 [Nitrosomonadaceae bacterium]|nr:hypothetical protein [Nitrosomonadaceae bacterium]